MNRFRVLNSDSLLCVTFLFFMGTASHAQELQSWSELDLSASWRHVDFLAPFVARIKPGSALRILRNSLATRGSPPICRSVGA